MRIVGQEKLVNIFNGFTRETLPKTIMLIGEEGCGKKALLSNLAERLELDIFHIKSYKEEDGSKIDLTDLDLYPLPRLYVIHIDNIEPRYQGRFLKFIEEQNPNKYVALIANSTLNINEAIVNRAVKYYFEPYSPELLKKHFGWLVASETDIVFNICTTPGQLSGINGEEIQALYDFCDKMVKKAKIAPYANMMTIVHKINYKEEYNKFDFNLFFNALIYASYKDYLETNNIDSFKIYQLTTQYKQQLFRTTINKENFVINFLDSLWRLTHETARP